MVVIVVIVHLQIEEINKVVIPAHEDEEIKVVVIPVCLRIQRRSRWL